MSSKIRCKRCKSILNAPDAARGKAIRCPKCKNVVRVPQRQSTQKVSGAIGSEEAKKIADEVRQLKEYQDLEEDGILADLDLQNAEDTSAEVCPKCGEDLYENDNVCPGCGFDLVAHAAGREQPVKKTRSQREAESFYRDSWRDSWAFMSNHKDLGIRTTLYWFFAAALGEACLGLAGNFALRKPPVAVFFVFTGLLFFFSMPGWGWSLWMEIIYGTLEKKKELKRVNLDVFLTMSLGIKGLFWFLINSLQFSIVTAAITVPLYFAAGPIQASLVGGLLSSTIGILIIPVVMAHMAMPVQWKAWVAPIMWKVSVKNIRPLLQWWIMAVVTCSASVVLMVITLAIVYYYALPVVDGLGQKIVLPEGITLPNQKISAVVAYVIIGGIVLLQILQFAFAGFASVFVMRAHGLFVRAFKRNLELITEVRKPKYVSKTEIEAKRIAEKEAKQHKKKLAKKRKKKKSK